MALNLYIYLQGMCFYDAGLPGSVKELGIMKLSKSAKSTQEVSEEPGWEPRLCGSHSTTETSIPGSFAPCTSHLIHHQQKACQGETRKRVASSLWQRKQQEKNKMKRVGVGSGHLSEAKR